MYDLEKKRFQNELEQLQQRKKELQEIEDIKRKIEEEKKAINNLKPKGFFKRMFTKDEY